MESSGASAGFTAWPGYDLRSSFKKDDDGLAPPQKLRIDRSAAEAQEGIVWHLDCGLLVTLNRFRQRLRALRVQGRTLPSYASHAKWCHTNFTYDDARGTDEQMLELFLLAGRPAGRAGDFDGSVPSLVRQEATVRVHQLCADSKTAKRKATKWPKEAAAAFAEPPAYAKQKERALQFIYDDEVPCGSLFKNNDAVLKWAPL